MEKFLSRVVLRNTSCSRSLSTVLPVKATKSEFTETAEYPPILDTSYEAKKVRKTLEGRERMKTISTIEEKLIEMNMKKYYGYKCLMLNEKTFPYNTLPYFQYATNTQLVREDHKPKTPEDAKNVETFLNLIKADVQDAIEFELDATRKHFEIKVSDITKDDINRAKTSGLVKQLNRILVNSLGADNRHLYESDADIDPRHEAFWFVGGIEPTSQVKKMRKLREFTKKYENDPVDRPFQYIGSPFLTLRHQHPLEPFEEISFDSAVGSDVVPSITVDPRAFGFYTEHRHGVTTPGFWPGNVREYGLISYQNRNFMKSRKNFDYGAEDKQDALHSQGIITSYAWLFAQASFQGFSTYNELTYPLSTQTVITDGQFWSFYKYQLNTTRTHTNIEGDSNPRYNKCWGTPEMKLFDEIDENGKMLGFNEEVLKNLIQFYVNQPKQREHEMKPYLGKDKKIADIEDVKQRDWLEKTFKHVMSNRPRHRLTPEIYNWEWIYKVNHQTRPLDRKLRFFELGINPFARRLNEHQPKYLPRHVRARGPHDKKKFDATYYPLDHRANIPKERSHSMMAAPRNAFAALMDRKRKSYK